MKVILIDDDEELLELLEVFLAKNDIEVKTAVSGREGLDLIGKERFDLAILDVMMPGMNGLEVLKEINIHHGYLPVILLTARREEFDRVLGLELGADDYIVKPFSSRELLARINAIKRTQKKGRPEDKPVKDEAEKNEKAEEPEDDVKLDFDKRRAVVRGEIVTLTQIEFDLLEVFIKNRGIVMSRDKIMDLVRGKEFMAFDRSIDVNISRLRQKIEKNPQNPRLIKTVWGAGYIFSGE